MVTALMVTHVMVTVLIVSKKWVQVLPVQCKIKCSVSTLLVTSSLLLNVLASIVNFHSYAMDLGEFVEKCWVMDIPLICSELGCHSECWTLDTPLNCTELDQ